MDAEARATLRRNVIDHIRSWYCTSVTNGEVLELLDAADRSEAVAAERDARLHEISLLRDLVRKTEPDRELLEQYERELDEIGRVMGCDHKQDGYLRCVTSQLAERDELARRAREVTCVWCGFQFESTLQSQAEHLYEHAKVCEKHPVRKAEAERDAYRKAKAENDERFMIERDDARAERDALRAELATLKAKESHRFACSELPGNPEGYP